MDNNISEEEFLIQMVRDFYESGDSETPISYSSSKSHNKPANLCLQEIFERIIDDEAEIMEKILWYLKESIEGEGEGEGDSTSKRGTDRNKWIALRLKMDGYQASLCTTSWVTPLGLSSDEYEFIDVIMKNDENGGLMPTRVIIDMDFKAQFGLARQTTAYTEILNLIPTIFVGTEEKLKQIISLLCSAAKQSLREQKLHIPPWRRTTYMKSKWLSENINKVSFSSCTEITKMDT